MKQVDRRLGRLAKQAKSGDKAAKAEQAVLEKVKAGFDQELPARALELDEDDLFELDLPPAVVGTAGIGGTNIASSPSVEQAFTLAINAIWSDKTARNVESILKSTSDNSSPNAIAKVEAKTM